MSGSERGHRSAARWPAGWAGALLVGLLTLALASALATGAGRERPAEIPLILVGLDGFRWDFLDRAPTPALDRIGAEGVRAERLIPVFPTKTFPNHYTIVTGLHPQSHGIVANNIYDPEMDERFSLGNRSTVEDPRWWRGEPLWVTARRQGRVTASVFWPGSEAPILGMRPDHWRVYDGSIPNEQRVDQVLAWLDLPPGRRPAFITLYFSDVDDAAHRFGPDAEPQVGDAVRRVDVALGRLIEGLESRGRWGRVHLLVVSDHGVAATPRDQVIVLDDYVGLEIANVVDWNPVLSLWPRAEDVETVYARLARAHPRLKVYRKAEIPERFRYRDSERIAPIVAIADGGWSIASRSYLALRGDRLALGNHGYDHELEDMGALFLATGPRLARGLVVPPFRNVHLYALMCHLLDLEPAPNEGDLGAVRHLLRAGPGAGGR